MEGQARRWMGHQGCCSRPLVPLRCAPGLPPLSSSLVSPSVTTVALGPGPRPLGPNSVPCWVIIQAAGDTCGSLCPVTWGKWSSWSLGSGGDWLLKGEGGYDSQTQQAITCFDLHHGPKLNLATNLS